MAQSKLAELRRSARKLERLEAQVDIERHTRNRLIFEAVTQDEATEREAAEAGKVSGPYAHRCVRYKGRPLSGPKLDEAAKAA